MNAFINFKKFDVNGNLTDEKAIDLIKRKLEALKELVLQLRAK